MDDYLSGERRISTKMANGNKADLNAKWDAFLDLGLRRFVYSSLAGGFAGLVLFRSPVTRWASVAFGAGVGIGSAYTECSHDKSDGSPEKN
ncbi:Mitochondrial inner membrane organizing system component [Castilleja foliolosa]|uniref:Mitochondrial inner membrane organizing system component n=1 Tax=Castilleja foliolosa TaxID=1961234 RepID=A0ABD3DIF2_9LAMI